MSDETPNNVVTVPTPDDDPARHNITAVPCVGIARVLLNREAEKIVLPCVLAWTWHEDDASVARRLPPTPPSPNPCSCGQAQSCSRLHSSHSCPGRSPCLPPLVYLCFFVFFGRRLSGCLDGLFHSSVVPRRSDWHGTGLLFLWKYE